MRSTQLGQQRQKQNQAESRQRGRPLKPRTELAATRKSTLAQRVRLVHAKAQKNMSAGAKELSQLERLPAELLSQIFFHALEVNLARASYYLRQALSNEPTYNALITLAYFDDDGESPVNIKAFLPATYRQLSVEEKVSLQTGILSCRWCTLPRITRCMSTLGTLVMQQAWYQERNEVAALGIDESLNEVKVVKEAWQSIARLPSFDDQREMESHFMPKLAPRATESGTRQTQHIQLPKIVTWMSQLGEDGYIYKTTSQKRTALAARSIPDWLLRECASSDERLELLQLLRQGYTFIADGHVMKISAEALFAGCEAAIQLHHMEALRTLLELHNALFKSGRYGIRRHVGGQLTAPSLYPLPIGLFHSVTKQAKEDDDSDSAMMGLLIRAGVDSLDVDDSQVTAWAVRRAQDGDEVATWLLKHMRGACDYGLPRRTFLFTDGCLTWRRRADLTFPFPEQSFAMELGYMLGRPELPSGPRGAVCGSG